jgi:TetR/AcrR family transcriptional regulator, transcriptional repressor of bet genes
MPKIVDHAQRRDEIAHVACQVVAHYGFEQATMARIARAAGYTTGMVAHYYESKQDIILAALRLHLLRIEVRLTRERESGEANLLDVLSESLAVDAERFTEGAFWMAFWGQVSADKKLKRLNVWVHREYMRLYARCLAEYWEEWPAWPQTVRDQVLRSVVTFIN